jgi:hypothetical protein
VRDANSGLEQLRRSWSGAKVAALAILALHLPACRDMTAPDDPTEVLVAGIRATAVVDRTAGAIRVTLTNTTGVTHTFHPSCGLLPQVWPLRGETPLFDHAKPMADGSIQCSADPAVHPYEMTLAPGESGTVHNLAEGDFQTLLKDADRYRVRLRVQLLPGSDVQWLQATVQ